MPTVYHYRQWIYTSGQHRQKCLLKKITCLSIHPHVYLSTYTNVNVHTYVCKHVYICIRKNGNTSFIWIILSMMHHDLNIISHFKSKANEVKKKLILWTNRDRSETQWQVHLTPNPVLSAVFPGFDCFRSNSPDVISFNPPKHPWGRETQVLFTLFSN